MAARRFSFRPKCYIVAFSEAEVPHQDMALVIIDSNMQSFAERTAFLETD
jgi:hypothetical protein